MNPFHEYYVLSNQVKIPKIGLGTWQISNADVYQVTLDAFSAGYRHIDSAQGYQNEKGVGLALKDSGLNRDEVFITTKLPSHIKGYQVTLDSFEQSMKDLQLEVLDLYLIHAPWPWNEIGKDCTQGNIESFKAMIDLYKQGRIRSIGVSNFSVKDLKAVIDATGFVPHVNQIRFYVSDTQEEIVKFCQEHNILVEAYSPLATGRILDNPQLQKIAHDKGVTIAQLCIRYCLDKGTLPLPKTTKHFRMVENAQVDFELSPEDIQILDEMKLKK
jgi:diketogulonate reductase-like aldo/keto reductase